MSESNSPVAESELYDEAYYKRGCGPIPYDRSVAHWGEFFGKIADELIRTFRMRRVFDAGCAKGFLVEALWERGVTAFGRDVSRYAISEIRADVRKFCSVGSLTEAIKDSYDLITCIEVLEHMPEDEALIAIANMTSAADIVVFSSSPSDFDEPTHVNVRPTIYWMRAFAKHGFVPLIETTLYSITPYALAFQRRDEAPTDDYLCACAEVVRFRIKQGEEATRIHELCVALNERTAEVARNREAAERALAELREQSARGEQEVVRNWRAAERELTNLKAQCERAEQDRVATEAALAAVTAERDAMVSGMRRQIDVNVHYLELVNQIQYSRSWRAYRKILRILHRFHLAQGSGELVGRLLGIAQEGRLLGFDREFYLAQYPDVAHLGIDPLRHYLDHGRAEGRAPTPAFLGEVHDEPKSSLAFDREFYLRQYPDVAHAGIDPLQHYLDYGIAEGRVHSQVFLEKVRNDSKTSTDLNLRDICDPERDEFGPKISDEAFRISVLTPTYNIEPRYIRELYQTLVNQTYSNWEWLVVDDGSTHASAIAVLRTISERDSRVKLLCSPINLGISGASNLGLSQARGTYVALVDHDDLLARYSFAAVYEAWKAAPETQLFYTDEAMLQADGIVTDLWAKPDWSPAYLEYTMCIGHLSVYRRDFLDALGGFRSEFDGTQDFDLALRALLRNPAVVHIPVFGYLWRAIPGSAAAGLDQKPYAMERQRKAVLGYARQRHPDADVTVAHSNGFWRIRYPLPSPPPLLSYVIPAGGGVRTIRGKPIELVVNCVRSFQEKAFYPNCEYVVVHNGSLQPEQVAALTAFPNVRLIVHSDPSFNFSRTINAGVAAARGEYVCLLNDDVEAITVRGGEEMVSYLVVNPDVAMIGPKCLFENGDIQQCGVALLSHAGPAHAATGAPRNFLGHRGNLQCRREVYCVGAAMLIARKTAFDEVGGFAEGLPLNYNDVDFGLRIRDRGYRCVVDPEVEVYHFESATKIGTAMAEQERLFLGRADMRDPYFSKWFDPLSPLYRLDIHAPDRRLPFGPWFDRYIARRAAQLDSHSQLELTVCLFVSDQPLRELDEAARSASVQTHNNQLLLADSGVVEMEARQWFAKRSNLGASALPKADNLGTFVDDLLARATGEFIIFLQASDFLSVDALQLIANAVTRVPDACVFYTDHYQATAQSTRTNPVFKPDFDPVLLTNFWYLGPLIAARRDLLERVGRAESDAPVSSLPYLLVAYDMLEGRMPTHVRELACAQRDVADNFAREVREADSHRRAVQRLIKARSGGALNVEPDPTIGQLRLRSVARVSRVKVLDAQIWANGSGIDALLAVVNEPDTEWVAVLLDGDRERTLCELSAVPQFDNRVNAVCGVLMNDSGALCWAGGVFLPGGRIFDPNIVRTLQSCVYPKMVDSQRCIDVAAPVNVMIRLDALARALHRFPIVDADDLMVALGLDAAERGELISVTPHVRAIVPSGLPSTCADRRGLVLNHPSLTDGSRWYNGRLEVERPYHMPGCA
ncbi:glycosyltransferase [Paraburkholderia sp. J8-2]|uniref:glycosyltransferase n=1 Tax=Paraburkholderia sp. J8-2 TaxID=2805440 RepID=UPI002AB732BE|nr:glycosyltransferase [Paraburkholderia sp. J8-2]